MDMKTGLLSIGVFAAALSPVNRLFTDVWQLVCWRPEEALSDPRCLATTNTVQRESGAEDDADKLAKAICSFPNLTDEQYARLLSAGFSEPLLKRMLKKNR